MSPSVNFGQDLTDGNNDGNDSTGNGTPNIEKMDGKMLINKLAGEGVVRVVKRCELAKENGQLNLSQCQLTQIPEAVFFLMRDTKLTTCDLSINVIKKIPPKLSIKFSLLTDLNLSNNEICKLPDEFVELVLLERLDISHNNLLNLPSVLFKMPKLRQLKANHNAILDIESDQVLASDSLELVDLRSNPLTMECYNLLKNACVKFHIDLSPRVKEDWEDLTI